MSIPKRMNYDKSDQPLNRLIFHPQQWTSLPSSIKKVYLHIVFPRKTSSKPCKTMIRWVGPKSGGLNQNQNSNLPEIRTFLPPPKHHQKPVDPMVMCEKNNTGSPGALDNILPGPEVLGKLPVDWDLVDAKKSVETKSRWDGPWWTMIITS